MRPRESHGPEEPRPGWHRRARRALAILGACSLAVAVALCAALAWLRLEDPVRALPRLARVPEVVSETPEHWKGRLLLHVVLAGGEVGPIRLVVSLPDPEPARPVPVAVILGGLRGGSESIRELSGLVRDLGPDAFVGYDWPLPTREPSVPGIVLRAPELRRRALTVPGQVAAILDWSARQRWADPGRLSLLGFSLGAFVAPASQRLAAERGVTVRWTVLGYGGAPIAAVVAGHPKAGPAWLRPTLGALAGLLLRPLDPSNHLPALTGRFLVLGARSDRLIAGPAARRLEELTPAPRTVIRLEGDHMGIGPERWRLLERVLEVSRAWLVEEGAIDPPGSRP